MICCYCISFDLWDLASSFISSAWVCPFGISFAFHRLRQRYWSSSILYLLASTFLFDQEDFCIGRQVYPSYPSLAISSISFAHLKWPYRRRCYSRIPLCRLDVCCSVLRRFLHGASVLDSKSSPHMQAKNHVYNAFAFYLYLSWMLEMLEQGPYWQQTWSNHYLY